MEPYRRSAVGNTLFLGLCHVFFASTFAVMIPERVFVFHGQNHTDIPASSRYAHFRGKPYVNRASPIHLKPSMLRCTSAMVPNDCERNESNRLSPWVVQITSNGVLIDSIIYRVAAEAAGFMHMPLPDPPGIILRAFVPSSLFASPLNTSCGTPSPE
jgi:hypothetical protein